MAPIDTRRGRRDVSLPGGSIPWSAAGTRLSPAENIPPDADRHPDRRRTRTACPPGAPAQGEASLIFCRTTFFFPTVEANEIAFPTDLDSHIVVNGLQLRTDHLQQLFALLQEV